MNTPFKVLSLEDSDLDFEIISEQLIKAGYNPIISRAETEHEFTSLICNNTYDIILADYNLPQFNAFEALKICNIHCPEIPFICVSGSIGEIMAIELLKMGAVDYVIKDRLERLPFAVKRALEEAEEKKALRLAQEELKQSEERLRDIIFSTADWVWEVDNQGRYTYSSQRDVDLFDVAPDEIIGKTPLEFMPPDEAERIGAIFSELIKNKEPIKDLENWNIGKDGKLICLLTNGLPILDNNGKLIGYRGVDKNITERKHAEQELISAKEKAEASDRLKTAFMNNISHEIRTPLNGILGFGQILADPEFPAEEKAGFFKMLEESSDRLLNTITNIMDISLLTSGNMKINKEEFNIDSLIRDVYAKFEHTCQQKNLAFSTQKKHINKDTQICTDEYLLNKILIQLIDNSIKFTSSGAIEISYKIKENTLLLSVKDSGIGISEKNKSQIFDNFMQEDNDNTRRYEGSGIGLSIVKGLTEILGGSITFESEKGNGSTFHLSIPID